MTERSEKRDMGLVLHRWLQYLSTASLLLLGYVITSGMDTWEKLKENAIRMENVPQDIRDIKKGMEEIGRTVIDHNSKIEQLRQQRQTP